MSDMTREVSDAMVSAYLLAQRRYVEEADRLGRPNCGGLHTDTVRNACRSGIAAALAARAQAAPAVEVPEGMLLVPKAALDWLFGIEGKFECPPERYFRGKPPTYWWRGVFLKKLLAAAPQPAQEGEPS